MKAVVYQKYGYPDVLELKEVSKPFPKDNEVLIKVHAASIIHGIGICLEVLRLFPDWEGF